MISQDYPDKTSQAKYMSRQTWDRRVSSENKTEVLGLKNGLLKKGEFEIKRFKEFDILKKLGLLTDLLGELWMKCNAWDFQSCFMQ